MSEPILFPDVEAVLVSALNAVLDDPASTRVPSPRPAAFVTVKRVGGNARQIVTDGSLVVVQCWATEATDASDLAQLARAHVLALGGSTVDGSFVRRVREIAGPQALPDPITELPRYQFTVQIDTRGVAL